MPKHKPRCDWVDLNDQLYIHYHDKEWGVPVYDDQCLFEFLILEGAQAGLSWQTVLRKRADYQKLFCEFDVTKVARFSDTKIEKLVQDKRIIRNRAKIKSAVNNAKRFLEVQAEFDGFHQYLWEYVDGEPIYTQLKSFKDYPSQTSLSAMIAKDLKKRGFTFVGPTIIYAYLQAVGIYNDHCQGCWRAEQLT